MIKLPRNAQIFHNRYKTLQNASTFRLNAPTFQLNASTFSFRKKNQKHPKHRTPLKRPNPSILNHRNPLKTLKTLKITSKSPKFNLKPQNSLWIFKLFSQFPKFPLNLKNSLKTHISSEIYKIIKCSVLFIIAENPFCGSCIIINFAKSSWYEFYTKCLVAHFM